MTEHPLTEEICEDLGTCITVLTAPGDPDPYLCPQYIADDMRAAANWQLKQDQKKLEDFLENFVCRGHGAEANNEVRAFVNNFKSCMRPQQQEDNS